ncbi:uncharacterized protein AKAME5_002337700 [Lates japonicus]|uniref:Uncharacterized protein n=1 Tax=Lates japonicus TaxID=270547 RepID=A0AAD3NGH3_LATJO|nr:uncharacterized protein AKAME5_002337700 [Lates japonicus]
MVTCTQEWLKSRQSYNPKVSQAATEVRTGQKWRAAYAVDATDSWLRHKVLVSAVYDGKAGLDSSTTPVTVPI